jgi:hypothetical protein
MFLRWLAVVCARFVHRGRIRRYRHGLTMIFLTIMPALIGGFGNWFISLMRHLMANQAFGLRLDAGRARSQSVELGNRT